MTVAGPGQFRWLRLSGALYLLPAAAFAQFFGFEVSYGVEGLSTAAARTVGEHAKREVAPVPDSGLVADLIVQHCPDAAPGYGEAVRTALEAQGVPPDSDRLPADRTTIEVPPCLPGAKIDLNRAVKVPAASNGSTLEALFRRNSGGFKARTAPIPAGSLEFALDGIGLSDDRLPPLLNTSFPGSASDLAITPTRGLPTPTRGTVPTDWDSLVRAVNDIQTEPAEGDRVVVPRVVEQRILLEPDVKAQADRAFENHVLANPGSPEWAEFIEENLGDGGITTVVNYRLYGNVERDACTVDEADDAMDLPAFRERLFHELVHSVRAQKTVDESRVLVLDYGVPDNNVDLPFDKFVDVDRDFWALPRGIPEAPYEHDHTVSVASVALGGPGMLPVHEVLAEKLRVRLLLKSALVEREVFVREDGRLVRVDNGAGVQVPKKAFDVPLVTSDRIADVLRLNDSSVVVISMGSSAEDGGMVDILESGTTGWGPLFVFASGNNGLGDGQGGVPLEGKSIFPQAYGLDHENVVVVAALDGRETLATFSNHGSALVDIATNGCGIPTHGFNKHLGKYVETRATGTSFAAPRVAYIGAVIRSLSGKPSWRHTKARLLASADLDPDFRDQVEDGRVLDPMTAVSISSDVVEIARDGENPETTTEPHVGRYTEAELPRSLDRYCEIGLRPQDVLLKVAAPVNPDDIALGKLLYYFMDKDGKFFRNTCKARDSIALPESLGGGSDGLVEYKQIRDIVFRLR